MAHKLFIPILSTLLLLGAACHRPIPVDGGPSETPTPDVPDAPAAEWSAFRARNYTETYRDGFEIARDAAGSVVDTPVALVWIAADGTAREVSSSELAAARADGTWQGYRLDELSVVQGSGAIVALNSRTGGWSAADVIVHNDVLAQLTASQGMFTIASTNPDQSRTTVIGEAHDIVALERFN